MSENNQKNDASALARIRNLERERAELATLPPEKALDRILEAPRPAALVHAMPAEDFYFLVQEIGLDDAVPLISLASDAQLEYILDLEGWRQDRIQIPVLTKWLQVMMRAQPLRLVPWLVEHKTEFTEFYLYKNIQVVIREHDEDPSVFGDDFFTLDDVIYVRILREPIPMDAGEKGVTHEEAEKDRLSFLRRLLNRLADYDHVRYQHLLMNAAGVLPAEMEETLFRLRNVRLAEKGFLPFDEAIGIYQPVSADTLRQQPRKAFGVSPGETSLLPVPLYPLGMLGEQTPFSDALRLLDSDTLLQHVQMEFATLCNQIIAADQRLIQDRAELRDIVRKACGYLNIGLESFGETESPRDTGGLARLWASFVGRYPLSQIFRLGVGRALDLKWRVERWQKSAWFAAAGLPLTFWGEDWMGVLGGVLIKKPLFFDNYQSGQLYREFESLSDIIATEAAVSQIMALDDLLSKMEIQCAPGAGQLLTYKSLVLTLWARHCLNPDPAAPPLGRLVPLSLAEFRRFFQSLFKRGSGDSTGQPRKTDASMKTSFLNWLSDLSGESAETITNRLGPCLDALFEEVDADLGGVSPMDLDPRFIPLFQVE